MFIAPMVPKNVRQCKTIIMNKAIPKILMISLFSFIPGMSDIIAQDNFNIVNYTTEDGGEIEAAYFDAGNKKAVIFAHGAIFNKESWCFLAEKLQDLGISSLAIDFRGYGNSTADNLNQKYFDILGAIKYLKEKGIEEIDIIGGSMGGAAVLQALSYIQDPLIIKVILLAPAGGPPIKNPSIDKLFIVSIQEGLYNRVKSVFNDSASPKAIKEYEGSAHSQHMFKADYAGELTRLIIDFIKD